MSGPARRTRALLASRPVMVPLSLAVTAAAVWVAARDADLARVKDALRAMPLAPFAVSFGCLVLGTLARGARLHALTRRATGARLLPALETILVGYFFTSLLPARTGEVVRIGYFARRTNAPLVTTTAAIALERAMDLVALALIAAVVLSDLAGRRIEGLPFAPSLLGVAAGASLLTAVAAGVALRKRLAARAGAAAGLARRIDEAAAGLSALASPRDVAVAFASSLALWFFVSYSIQTALTAIGARVPLADAAVIMLGTCFTIALPGAPGFVGTYHAGFVEGARLVGIAPEASLPVAIVLHLVIQLPFLPIGGLVLLSGGRKALARPIAPSGAP